MSTCVEIGKTKTINKRFVLFYLRLYKSCNTSWTTQAHALPTWKFQKKNGRGNRKNIESIRIRITFIYRITSHLTSKSFPAKPPLPGRGRPVETNSTSVKQSRNALIREAKPPRRQAIHDKSLAQWKIANEKKSPSDHWSVVHSLKITKMKKIFFQHR